jgi:hypothetical protein
MQYLRIFGTKHTSGGAPMSHKLAGRAWWAYGSHKDPLTYSSRPSPSFSSRKNHPCSQAHVLAHFAANFDLLAWNSVSKTVWWNYSSVCDSSNAPISFCSSALCCANFAAVVIMYMSLHVEFVWSKVVLMHDIATKHLWE